MSTDDDLLELKPITLKEPEKGHVKAWSFNRLTKFETCPHMVWMEAVKRVKPPERPDDHPSMRGNKIHDELERYTKGEAEYYPPEADYFREYIDWLAEMYRDGKASFEGNWGFDKDWNQCDWWAKDVWARIKLDAFVRLDESSALVVDYKTGKRWGNEVKHTMQGQLYVLAAFLREPELESVKAEFLYLDEKKSFDVNYTIEEFSTLLDNWTRRANILTSATTFPPKPTRGNCRYCDFGIHRGNGECGYAVPWN